jgi:hypothetical protein
VTKAWQWIRRIPASVILALGWLWLVIYAFPGVMTMDSFDQLREGREGVFSDAHPPIMAALWGILDRIVAGPLPMLVIQSTAFLGGTYLILRRVFTPRAAAVAACALFIYPPVFCTLAVIWKDCLMAGALVLGIAGITSEQRRLRIWGLVALSVATALRYTALAATLPLIVLLFEWQPGLRAVKRYAIATATWLAVTVVALGGNALLTDREVHFWHASLGLQDIAGTLAFVDDDLPDSELEPLLGPTEITVHTSIHRAIRAQYKSDDFQQLISGDGRIWDVPWYVPMPQARRAAITHAWLTLVEQHPGAYLRYRLENFGETLGVNRRFGGVMVVSHRAQYKGMLEYFGFSTSFLSVQQPVEDAFMWLARHTRLWRPHVYALLALALLGLAITWRQRDVIAFLLSGLFLELTMLVLGGTPDYRYSHWLVFTACMAGVVLAARRAAERRDHASS